METSKNILERLGDAINAHDLDALVACFAPDVESVQPAHPARNFRGRDRIRENWTKIFASVKGLRAQLVQSIVNDEGAWSEWQWSGTRVDGEAFEMRGVTIQRLRDDAITSLRFYMEPLEVGGEDIGGAVREAVGR